MKTSLTVLPRKPAPAQGLDKLRAMSVAQSKPKEQYINNIASSATPPVPTTTAPNRDADFRNKLAGIESQAMKIQELINQRRKAEETAATTKGGPSNALKEMSSALSSGTAMPDFYSGARSAMEKYIESLSPTSAENKVAKNISNLRSSISGGIQAASEQAIPMTFITGQQQAIENRGLNALQPYQDELARLVAEREGLSTGLKARQEFEQGLAGTKLRDFRDQEAVARDERRQAYEVARDAAEPIEFGGALYQRNPDGGFTEIMAAPAETPEPFELSEGQSRYVFNPATGEYEMIASKGKTYKPTGSGTDSESTTANRVDQLLGGFITLDDLSSTERMKVQDELFALGLGDEQVPTWYQDYYQAEEAPPVSLNVPGIARRWYDQPGNQKTIQQSWNEYRKKIMQGKKSSGSTSSEISFDSI